MLIFLVLILQHMQQTEIWLTLIRFLSAFLLLFFASYSDLKTRTVSDKIWVLMGVIGLLMLVIQYFSVGFETTAYLLVIPMMFGVAYLLFRVGVIFGGADAKALMSLSILVPFWPKIGNLFPLWASILPFPWVIFSNSIFLFLFIPFILIVINAFKKNLEFPYYLVGYKMSIDRARKSFVWPLERVDDKGERSFVWHPVSDEQIQEEFDRLEKLGRKMVWVTPKIPFMIPLLIGFVLSFIVGDILYFVITSLASMW